LQRLTTGLSVVRCVVNLMQRFHAALDVLNQERLKPDHIVIIRDNLGSHKVAGVRDAIEARGFNRSPL
jgi:hypothetical protein